MTQRTAFLAVLLTSALAYQAAADTKSWTAIKGKLPADTMVVVSVDVAAARTTPVYGKLVDAVTGTEKDLAEGLTMLKTTCQIDPTTAVTDVTIALDEHEKGIIVVGMTGVDEAKLIACGNAIQAKENPKKKLTGAKVGQLTEYTMTGEKDKLYAAWLAKDVVAFGTNPDKPRQLAAMLAGKPATGDLAIFLGKVNTSSFAWVAAVAINADPFKGGFGAATLTKDTVSAAGAITTKSADAGKSVVAEAQKEQAKAVKKASKDAPELGKALNAVKLSSSGADIVVAGSLKLSDLATVIPQFLEMI
jgi:hypothetical protein